MNATTTPTLDATALVERYLAIWNEKDSTRRRALIEETWTEEASYLDPLMRGEGHSGINSMIQAAQTQFGGLHFRPRNPISASNKVDAHNGYLRFSWELAPEDGAAVAGGTDFAMVAADGRLQRVIGFIDFAPATDS